VLESAGRTDFGELSNMEMIDLALATKRIHQRPIILALASMRQKAHWQKQMQNGTVRYSRNMPNGR
jgi:hypothetical protein